MNGKITYTVDMKDVPNEVKRMLESLASKSENLKFLTNRCTANIHNTLAVLDLLIEIREELSLLDFNYEDCYSILTGYLQYEVAKASQRSKPKQEVVAEEKEGKK